MKYLHIRFRSGFVGKYLCAPKSENGREPLAIFQEEAAEGVRRALLIQGERITGEGEGGPTVVNPVNIEEAWVE